MPAAPARRFLDVAGAVWWRSTHNFLTNPQFILPSIMFPLFFFIAFAGGLSSVGDVPGFDFPSGYTAFQFCFVLLQASAFGGVFTGFGIASDFENGFARRLMLGASSRSAILAGYVLTALTRATVVLSVVTLVAVLSGMQVDGGPLDVFGMFALAAIVSLAATLFAAGVALRARTIQAGPAMQMPVFLVLFLAPVYVPLELLAGWVQAVARLNPVTPILEAARGLISGGDADLALAGPVAVALVLLFALWALRGLGRAERAGG
ncbi:MAG TPA: ABC transporter permease [Solirubrobacteraceae bacterium]|nr:ABC transporter permease [Solirubrobacteraceae bacterium]